ncbi:MAG: hypothetical protein KGJ90_07170 [Patescibacteria group bacterium]|nr:hypothetical protein [Patescibacteria group bacterium]
MDKMMSHMFGKAMHEGEKKAPVKSIKLKVKFQKGKKDKDDYEMKKHNLAKKKY